MRYQHSELFDASNLDGEGEVVPSDSPRVHYNKGNAIFVRVSPILAICIPSVHFVVMYSPQAP